MIHANHLDVLDTDVGFELVDSVTIGSLAGGLDVREFRVGLSQGLDKWFEHRCIGLHIVRLGNNDELRVTSRTEALFNHGDGLAVRAVLSRSRVGRQRQLQVHGRVGQCQQQDDTADQEQPWGLVHESDPTSPHRHLTEEGRATFLARVTRGVASNTGHATSEDLVAQQRHNCRQQGQRDQHCEGHRNCRRNTHQRHERHLGDRQRCQSDNHGEAGENHSGASRTGSHADGVFVGHPSGSFCPVAREDEQCVVNTDSQAEHDGKYRGNRVDVGECGHQCHAEDTDDNAHYRRHNRQERSDQRSEGDNQHDKCHGHTDNLRGRSYLNRGLHARARGLDLDTGVTTGLHRVEKRLHILRFDVLRHLGVENEGGNTVATVIGHGTQGIGIGLGNILGQAGGHALFLDHRLHLRIEVYRVVKLQIIGDLADIVADAVNDLVNSFFILWVIEPLPLRGLEGDIDTLLSNWVRNIGELFLNHVRSRCRRHAGDRELVDEPLLECGNCTAQPRQNQEPRDDHSPFMQVGEPAEFEQGLCHVKFPLRLIFAWTAPTAASPSSR